MHLFIQLSVLNNLTKFTLHCILKKKVWSCQLVMKQATNSASMRIKNEKIILSLINKSPVSRVDIAKKTGLTKAAVTIIVDDLKQRGIVTEQNGKSDTVGRNPVMLFLNEKAFFAVGVNITRHHITVGITDLGGNIVVQDDFSICPPDEALIRINKTVEKQVEKFGIDISKILKMSVVSPGPVDTDRGIILNPPNFKDWNNVPIVSELKGLTGFDVILENVSSATAIAEKYFGAASETENFLTLRIDEGIGSGIVINDSLFKGPCELGHTSIKFDGIKCECGNRGCLEKYASIPRILDGTPYKSWRDVVDCGDEKLFDTEAEYLSTAIISANNIFDFDRVVLCGELTSYESKRIIELISTKIEKNTLSKKLYKVCAGKVKSKLIIATSMAIHDFFV